MTYAAARISCDPDTNDVTIDGQTLPWQITTAIDEHLETRGSACVVKATHSCMSLRGVKAVGAHMVTSSLTGTFRTDPAARAEFMATID